MSSILFFYEPFLLGLIVIRKPLLFSMCPQSCNWLTFSLKHILFWTYWQELWLSIKKNGIDPILRKNRAQNLHRVHRKDDGRPTQHHRQRQLHTQSPTWVIVAELNKEWAAPTSQNGQHTIKELDNAYTQTPAHEKEDRGAHHCQASTRPTQGSSYSSPTNLEPLRRTPGASRRPERQRPKHHRAKRSDERPPHCRQTPKLKVFWTTRRNVVEMSSPLA